MKLDDRYHTGGCNKTPKVIFKVPGGTFYQYAAPGEGERVDYGTALPSAPCSCGFEELALKAGHEFIT